MYGNPLGKRTLTNHDNISIDTLIADSGSQSGKMDSQRFKAEIIKAIQPDYLEEIKYSMKWRIRWQKTSSALDVLSVIMAYIGIILTFISASGIIAATDVQYWGFAGGAAGVVSRLLARFSAVTKKESQEKTDQVNELLQSVGISYRVPDTTDDDSNEEDATTPTPSLTPLHDTGTPVDPGASDLLKKSKSTNDKKREIEMTPLSSHTYEDENDPPFDPLSSLLKDSVVVDMGLNDAPDSKTEHI